MDRICVLNCKDKVSAIREVISQSAAFSMLSDRKALLKAVLKREELGSTCLGHGVLATHGQLHNENAVHVGLGVSPEGFPVESGDLVHFVLVFATNPKRYDLYVSRLAALMKDLHDEAVRAALLRWELEGQKIQDLLGLLG